MIEHGIQLDTGREERIGFDEAIYAAGKDLAQLEALVAHALQTRASRLFTRLDREKHAALSTAAREALDYDPVSRTAFLGMPHRAATAPRVAIVTGGSSDLPASLEAVRTLAYYGPAWPASGACSTESRRSGRCAW
jgi:NCAIR mutase (PurE)-related protein